MKILTSLRQPEITALPDKRLNLGAAHNPGDSQAARQKETDGVIISSAKPDSAASEAGLKRGDPVKEIDRKPIRGMADYSRALNEAERRMISYPSFKSREAAIRFTLS
ncbi:MAG: PDZ domain-containing protein [Microthrixaceae bacterium]|nr:PDZ domain-containing protein [Microthrixaceae bacterium]